MEYSIAIENADIHRNTVTRNNILSRKNKLIKQYIRFYVCFLKVCVCVCVCVCVSTEKGLKGYSSK